MLLITSFQSVLLSEKPSSEHIIGMEGYDDVWDEKGECDDGSGDDWSGDEKAIWEVYNEKVDFFAVVVEKKLSILRKTSENIKSI